MDRRRDSQRGDRGGGRRALANGATAVALPAAGGMAESSGWVSTGEESLGARPTAEGAGGAAAATVARTAAAAASAETTTDDRAEAVGR